jgi:hypothetical protein
VRLSHFDNITMILEDPAEYGPLYRKSGLKEKLLDVEKDQATYAGKPEWDSYNQQQMRALDVLIRGDGLIEDEIRQTRGGFPVLARLVKFHQQHTSISEAYHRYGVFDFRCVPEIILTFGHSD